MPIALPKAARIARPSILTGVDNGHVPASLLEPTNFGNALAVRPAARAFRALAAFLRTLGVDPRHVGGYRSYAGQVSLLVARMRPVSWLVYIATPASRRRYWPDTDPHKPAAYRGAVYWVKKQNPDGSYPASVATPGTSNHGDGLALDIAEELDGDPSPESIRPATVGILVAHAARFGISAESDAEPWHWTYHAGDNVPAAVLEYEAGGIPAVDYPRPTIRLGSTGAEVLKFQRHNNQWCPVKLAEDGQCGPKTVAQIRAFQLALKVTDDGVWGPVTADKYRAVLVDIERAKARPA